MLRERSSGLSNRAVGAVVMTVKLTAVELVVVVWPEPAAENLHVASLGRPEQE
jgi:hypothetical protein